MSSILPTAIVAALVATLAACGSVPTSVADTRPAPAERITASFATPPQGDYSTLIVTRDKGVHGSALAIKVIVNGQQAAALRTGERATLYVPPGETVMTATVLRSNRSIETVLKPGATRVYRVGIDGAGGVDIGPANFGTGE